MFHISSVRYVYCYASVGCIGYEIELFFICFPPRFNRVVVRPTQRSRTIEPASLISMLLCASGHLKVYLGSNLVFLIDSGDSRGHGGQPQLSSEQDVASLDT